MPDPLAPGIGVVADLTFEVGDGSRRTRAHLSGGPTTLVLDVDDPAVLFRSLPAGRSWRRLPAAGVSDLLSGTTIQVRSGGSALGSLRLERGRRAVLRPTVSGLAVAGRTVLARRPVRIAVVAIGAAVAATKLFSARRAR